MNLKQRLLNKLNEIADCLLNEPISNTEIGVLSGISGVSLFHFYYSRFKNDERHEEKGTEIILETFNRIQNGYNYPTFCNGIAGAFWVLELLKEEKFIELDQEIITEDVDSYLFQKMNEFIDNNYFDFLHGAIGIGFYYLKRYQNVKTDIFKKRYEEYLNYLISAIKDAAIIKNGIVKWESEIISGEYRAKGYNLGLAHGIPSIINFLSRLLIYPVFVDEISKLLKPACQYILSCKHNDSNLSSSFPNWIVEGRFDSYNSRLAWCYGDLGIGLSILKAGQALKDIFLINEATEVLIKTTLRKDIDEARILDAGLCHGAYGVLNLYNQIYYQTKNPIFKNSMEYWANISLDLAIHKDGYAGYKELDYDSWKSNQQFLGGISGIGLAIINHIESNHFKWNEALLIS